MIEQLEKNPATSRSAARRYLPHDAVLRRPGKIFHARRQEHFHRFGIQLAQKPGHLDGFGDGPASHGAPQVLQSLFAEIGGQVGDMLGIFSQAAAVEPHGELLHGRLRKHFQNVGHAGGGLPGSQSLVDKFRNAFFDAHFRAQAAPDAGPLRFDAGNQIERLLHHREAPAGGGLLAKPHECGAYQRLQIGVLLDAQPQAQMSQRFAEQLGIGFRVKLGHFGQAHRGFLARIESLRCPRKTRSSAEC